MNKCFVCSSSEKLHRLPIAPEYRALWLASIPHVTAADFNQNFKVCSLHFDDKYITQSGRLTRNAVPSKFGNFVLQNGVWYSIEVVDSSTNNEMQDRDVAAQYPSTSNKTSPSPVSCNFRYAGDIDLSVEYTPDTYKHAIGKLQSEIHKLRFNHKQFRVKYNKMKAKVKDLEQFLNNAERDGIISTEYIEKLNIRKSEKF